MAVARVEDCRITACSHTPGGHTLGGGGRTGSTRQNSSTLVQANSEFAVGRSADTHDPEQRPACCQKPPRHIPRPGPQELLCPFSRSVPALVAEQYG